MHLTRRSFVGASSVPFVMGIPKDVLRTTYGDNPQQERPYQVEYPSDLDAFIVASHGTPLFHPDGWGWDDISYEQLQRSLLGLQPDIMDFLRLVGYHGPPEEMGVPPDTRDSGLFALENGLPATTGIGMNLNVESLADWYNSLPESEKWRFPDGSIAEDIGEVTSRWLSGERQRYHTGSSFYVPTIYAPEVLDRFENVATDMFGIGFSGFFVDSASSVNLIGFDISPWATAAFQSHLESQPQQTLSEFGIDEPDSFELPDYLERENLMPHDVSTPVEDPVVREYVLFHHKHVKAFYNRLRNRLEAAFPERSASGGIQLYGNQFIGTDFRNTPIASTYLSDPFHVVNIEDNPTVPPDRIRDVVYKYGLAAGRYEKPVFIEGKMQTIIDSTYGLDPTEHYPVLMTLQIAEGYAMGAVRKLSLTGWAAIRNDQVVNNLVHQDGTIDESIHDFVAFLRANQRFLDDVKPANDVAIVFSLPTLLWRVMPQWQEWQEQGEAHLDSLLGAAELLREHHFPYDIIIFGHPELWTDEAQLDRLASYSTVVLPNVESITDSQIDAIKAALDADTTVIASGQIADRTEMYQPQSGFQETFTRHGNSVELSDDPARKYRQTGADGVTFVDAVLAAGPRQINLPDGLNVGTNVLTHREHDLTFIHLVNYDYDASQDAVSSKSGFELRFRHPAFEPRVVEWRTPSETTVLEVGPTSNSGEYVVTIPALEPWGFLIVAATESSLEPDVSESVASTRIGQAKQAIADAESAGRTMKLLPAKIAADSASLVHEYGGYSIAAELGETALSKAESAYRPTRVGIDQAHGQPMSELGFEAFGDLRSHFDQNDYVSVTDWTTDELSNIDVLVIPPALEFLGAAYEFTTAELDRVQQFVENGGSLVILARGGAESGVNDLAGRFGFAFDGGHLATSTGFVDTVRVETNLTAFTRMVPFLMTHVGTCLTEVGDGTVFGRVPEDSAAWVNRDGSREERDPQDEAAAGKPVGAVNRFGSGFVVVYGSVRDFTDPVFEGNRRHFVRNVLNVLGELTANATMDGQSATSTPTDTSTASTSDGDEKAQTDEDNTDTSLPGFGIASAIAGITSAALLFKKLRQREQR